MNIPRGMEWAQTHCDHGIDGATSPRRIATRFGGFTDEPTNRFGSSILERSLADIDSILWVNILLDREELHPRADN